MQEARSETFTKEYGMNTSFTRSQNNAHSLVLSPFPIFLFLLNGCVVGMGKTVLLREPVLSVPVTITNRLIRSIFVLFVLASIR